MKIAFLSNAPAHGTFRLGSHHLARELARMGHSVAHVSTPVSRFERLIGREAKSGRFWRAPALSEEKVALSNVGSFSDSDGVLHSTPCPLLPARWLPGSPSIRDHLDKIDFYDADYVVLDQLSLRNVQFNDRSLLIYRPTDTLPPESRLRHVERKLLASVDAIVAPSRYTLNDVAGGKVELPNLVLENGVDARFFSYPEPADRQGIVYVGAVDYRFDWHFVIQAANELPKERFIIAGPISTGPRGGLPPNIQMLGGVAHEDLPSLLSHAKVGILPLNDAVTNRGRSPMKFFEYLAAGLYVVARRTPALAEREAIPGSFLYMSPGEGVAAIKDFAARQSANHSGALSAKTFEWGARAKILTDFLSLEVGQP